MILIMASVSERINTRILEYRKRQRKFWMTFHWEGLTKPKLCNSYLIAFINILRAEMIRNNTGEANTNDVDNVARILKPLDAGRYDMTLSGVADLNAGIVVGTGTNAVVITNVNLQTLIANGVGAGQLSYGATSIGNTVTVGSTRRFTIARTMTNNSGASITVQEAALRITSDDDGSIARTFTIERVLTTQAIANAASATATYTVGVTV